MRFNRDLLLKERYKKGYTQQNIADRAGISKSVIGKYESNRSVDPSFIVIYRISKVLNVDLKDFIQNDN